ncbi:MAG: CTP synthase [SAR202 cluster bacterium]|nr:CTP synthase [SAR202 cluster bacterium]
MAKFVFVTGGVVSSVGKGVCVGSIGKILKNQGFEVSLLKLDPYLNVDPGTMSPYQHGEVFVTTDGGETDLDLGHYERFVDVDLTRSSNLTAGQVYSEVISRERKGEFLGGTIQVVPHLTDRIKQHMHDLAEESDADVIVVEVGGTVGDIEGLPFLEAIRQMRNEVGRDNVFYIHLTFLPSISSTGELKTKPTQHSVRELRGIGIHPDAIVCRSDSPVPESLRQKIVVHCDVPLEGVFTVPTVSSIYEVPLLLEKQGIPQLITDSLNLISDEKSITLSLNGWGQLVERIKTPKENLKIGLVGKYVDLHDAYMSVKEALIHAGLFHSLNIDIDWIAAEEIEKNGPDQFLKDLQGIVIPGGFGDRGIEGMVSAVQYARENKIPYLGLCLGMQVMVIEAARNLLGKKSANSQEFDANTPDPVIHLMEDQVDVTQKGGTMRLGVYPCVIQSDSLTSRAYDESLVMERHRHRYEVNNDYREGLLEVGLKPTGLSPDGNLVEIMEIEDHPFMAGTQFHPEFLSRPVRPHPMFREFVGKSYEVAKKSAL